MKAYKKAVAAIRAAGRAVASAPYWGMALLAAADNGGDVHVKPLATSTRFTFTNPRRPHAGHTMTLVQLFPQIPGGTIDGIIKQGVHFAHAARVAGVAGAATAVTPEAWRGICERYGVEYEGIRHVAGPLAAWYRDGTLDHTPTGFRATIDEALAPPVDDDDDDTGDDDDTTDEDENVFLAMVTAAGYPRRRDRLEAWLVETLALDAVTNGGTGLVLRTGLLVAKIDADQRAARDAAIVADGANAQTLVPTGTDG